MRVLLTAPFSGEYGWEIATWIPYIRKYSRSFDKVIIGCDPEMEYFYKDFAHEIYHRKNPGKGDRWLDHGKITEVPKYTYRQYKKLYPDMKVMSPEEQYCMAYKKREYKAYGEVREDCKYDIVIHARALRRYQNYIRNWPLVRWGELVDYLKGYKICCIGKDDQAYHVPGTVDKIGVSTEELCNILASSRLTIGPSSGPMHLAHMCRCPILVWTTWKPQKVFGWMKKRGNTNRDRYEKLWRAWDDVYVGVLDKTGWRPKLRTVHKSINNYFKYTEKGRVFPSRWYDKADGEPVTNMGNLI